MKLVKISEHLLKLYEEDPEVMNKDDRPYVLVLKLCSSDCWMKRAKHKGPGSILLYVCKAVIQRLCRAIHLHVWRRFLHGSQILNGRLHVIMSLIGNSLCQTEPQDPLQTSTASLTISDDEKDEIT